MVVSLALLVPVSAFGAVLTSPNYRLDPNVANNFGGGLGSTNYKLTDAGGEGTIGSDGSASYKLTQGYVSQLTQSIQIFLTPSSSVTIPTVSPNTSQNVSSQATVNTDAPAYDLYINQDHDLLHTDATTTIPAVSGTIASTFTWSEGSTKGLGFTITGGSQIESDWGTTPNYKYAAIPNSSTLFHSHSGFLGGGADVTTVQFRLDVAPAQKNGNYSNNATFTATMRP